MQRALHYSHTLLAALIARFPDGHYIDGTLGKGNDTHFILSQPDFSGQVTAFDIQAAALQFSEQKLASLPNRSQATLLQASHHLIDALVEAKPLHGAIYNLGYLPGGDHQITTAPATTLQSIQQVAQRLVVGGQIILVIYSGHPEGQIEKNALFEELSQWPQEQFQVLHYGFINQRNHPPQLLIIERIAHAKN